MRRRLDENTKKSIVQAIIRKNHTSESYYDIAKRFGIAESTLFYLWKKFKNPDNSGSTVSQLKSMEIIVVKSFFFSWHEIVIENFNIYVTISEKQN